MSDILNTHHLSVALNTVKVVDDLSFCLNPKETLALLGESGSGKSMTALAMMRLLPLHGVYAIDSDIQFDGLALLDIPLALMRALRGRRLAMIFQEPMTALNPVLTIGTQLAEVFKAHHDVKPHVLKSHLIALLQEVEMPQPELQLSQYPHQLSGGQKQRVVIAMAIACRPDVLLADEPTTALDVSTQAQILTLLKKLQSQYNMSLLLITHDLGVVKAMADRVCVMYAGQFVETCLVHDFFNKPLHPYAQQLMLSLPSLAKRSQRLQVLKGQVPSMNELPSGCRFHPRCEHAFTPCANKEPLLQPFENTRTVRCHLYPSHTTLPSLPLSGEDWGIRDNKLEPILTVKHMSVHFGAGKHWFRPNKVLFQAVDDLSFTLYKGRTLALVGESGCGKTTVSRALVRLLPMCSGEVFFESREISSFRGRALRNFRKQVQIIFQDPYSSMNPRMTVEDILAEGLRAEGMPLGKIKLKLTHLLDQVHLSKSSLNRYPHQFSGGQRQRICIARALAKGPKVLICDEPTSALDMSVQAQILNLLKSLQQDNGLSYLFITHNMGVVSYIADDVLVMREGRAIEMGGCEDLLTNPSHAYTRQLLDSVLS